MSKPRQRLTDEDRAVYQWQMWADGFGEAGQEKLKNASVLVSRVGGVGGLVAYELAAAGIGKLVLAHAGDLRPSDLNRQLLMTHDWISKSRVECAARRLKELNPRLEVEAVAENVSDANADRLVSGVDAVVDCAPLFEERYAMNRAAARAGKPLIECAVYEFEAHIATLVDQGAPCLECLYPVAPTYWKREFPVFGAVAGMAGCLGAAEAVKVIAGLGEPLRGQLLACDLRDMAFRKVRIAKDPRCAVCGSGRWETGAGGRT